MFRRRDDVSTEVELIDLPKGDDIDPFNVITANLRGKSELNLIIPP